MTGELSYDEQPGALVSYQYPAEESIAALKTAILQLTLTSDSFMISNKHDNLPEEINWKANKIWFLLNYTKI